MEETIAKINEIKNLDIPESSKIKKFKMLYRSLMDKILRGSNYCIEGWKNSKNYLSCYIRDRYTGRLMFIKIPDIHLNETAWKENIQLSTVNKVYGFPNPLANYCTLDNLVNSLNKLNVFYRQGAIPYYIN